jgi:hypothetical protein
MEVSEDLRLPHLLERLTFLPPRHTDGDYERNYRADRLNPRSKPWVLFNPAEEFGAANHQFLSKKEILA